MGDTGPASGVLLDLLTHHATDIVYLLGVDGTVTWMSPSVTETLGYTPEELLHRPMFGYMHPDDRIVHQERRDIVLSGRQPDGEPPQSITRVRHRDGHYISMSLKVTVLDPDVVPGSVAVIGLRDVDALVEARERAERDRRQLSVTIDAVPDCIGLMRAERDRAGTIIDFRWLEVNASVCSALGVTAEQIVGRSVRESLPVACVVSVFDGWVRCASTSTTFSADEVEHPGEIEGAERYHDVRAAHVEHDLIVVTWRDVTERVNGIRQLRESERRYRLLATNSSDVVLRVRDREVMWASPSLVPMLGWDPADVVSQPCLDYVDPRDLETAASVLSRPDACITRLRLLDRSGEPHWCEVHLSPFLDDDGACAGSVITFRVIDHEVEAEEALRRQAQLDGLTGIHRREEAWRLLDRLSRHDQRTGRRSAVLFCDLDDFKAVNDRLGHQAGDEMLRSVAGRLRRSVRAEDLVARIGGDEFLVVLQHVHGTADARSTAQSILRSVQMPLVIADEMFMPSMSIGVALVHEGEEAEAVVSRADSAMYIAKRRARGMVSVSPDDLEPGI